MKKAKKIGTKVYGSYKIASMPYYSKVAVYEDIRNYWDGIDCTAWYDQDTGNWYIVSPLV